MSERKTKDYSVNTVGELREVLNMFPGDMPLGSVECGGMGMPDDTTIHNLFVTAAWETYYGSVKKNAKRLLLIW